MTVRSQNRGDYLGNRIRYGWATPIANGTPTTIQADVRWQRGSTNLLFRLKGNHLELAASVDPPTNLGTPGGVNTGVSGNTGPAISEVKHWPIVPKANEAVAVTARLHDPNGLSGTALPVVRYRVDPSASTTDRTLRDDGTQGDALAGDGVFTAVIPGQAAGVLVAFFVEATDNTTPGALTSKFPSDAPVRECLVRFGDSAGAGSLGVYRLWMTAATATAWATRSSAQINNHPLDVTFVYGQERAIYNAGAAFSGSDNTAITFTTPSGVLCGYALDFPNDERFLGSDEAALDWPIQDRSGQREQLSYWLAQQLGLPFSRRRFIHLFVNGVAAAQRPNVNGYLTAHVYEDVQSVDSDFLEQWYRSDPDGDLFKLQVWRQGTAWPLPGSYDQQHARLGNYLNAAQQKHLPAYRWNWRKRAARDSVNDYTRLYALVDAVHDTANYVQSVQNVADMEQWMRVFAVERMIGNIDGYSRWIGHNMFAYKPINSRWNLLLFDIDLVMGVFPGPTDGTTTPLFSTPVEDPKALEMIQNSTFQRAYWRAFRDAVNGPMLEANYGSVVTAAYNHLKNAVIKQGQNGTVDVAEPGEPAPGGFKAWLNGRRTHIENQLLTVNASFAITTGNGTAVTIPASQNQLTLTGTAPVEVASIQPSGANATAGTLTWPAITTWNLPLTLAPGVSPIMVTVQGLDRFGQPLQPTGTYTKQITITRQ
jgi:hypothetical protein